MIEEIKISKAKFLRSIRNVVAIVIIVWIMFILSTHYLMPDITDTPLKFAFAFPILFTLFTLGPSFLIYLNYLKIDKDTIIKIGFSDLINNDSSSKLKGDSAVQVDSEDLVYTIKSSTINITFRNKDIIKSTLVVGSRLYTGVGYLKLKISGQKDYVYLTSLLFDVENFPFRIDDAYDVVLPMISEQENLRDDMVETKKDMTIKVQAFKKQYSDKSKEELEKIISEADNYQIEAVIAANELITELTTAHNSV